MGFVGVVEIISGFSEIVLVCSGGPGYYLAVPNKWTQKQPNKTQKYEIPSYRTEHLSNSDIFLPCIIHFTCSHLWTHCQPWCSRTIRLG